MDKPYHVGLVKQGKTLVIQYAASVDQLSCELWKYAGERLTSGAPGATPGQERDRR